MIPIMTFTTEVFVAVDRVMLPDAELAVVLRTAGVNIAIPVDVVA